MEFELPKLKRQIEHTKQYVDKTRNIIELLRSGKKTDLGENNIAASIVMHSYTYPNLHPKKLVSVAEKFCNEFNSGRLKMETEEKSLVPLEKTKQAIFVLQKKHKLEKRILAYYQQTYLELERKQGKK
ncbi:hypothetical protein HY989_01355 [Candidatus Micrarchaeota archaeon]|nr:hypothetical protein [Candidatus Micrarchaeota archaeon]